MAFTENPSLVNIDIKMFFSLNMQPSLLKAIILVIPPRFSRSACILIEGNASWVTEIAFPTTNIPSHPLGRVPGKDLNLLIWRYQEHTHPVSGV